MLLLDAAMPGSFGGTSGFGAAIAIGFAVLAALTAVVILLRIRRKKKNKENPEQKEEEQ